MFGLYRRLNGIGVLGINRRNADYTLKYNSRKLYPLVDDKLRTKELALAAGIEVPELYLIITHQYQIKAFEKMVGHRSDFALKPSRGSGGQGIMIISGRVKDNYRIINGLPISRTELQYHLSNMLSGMFSLGGQPDKVIVEYRVKFDPVFETISYQGVPDIRIIVFLGVPVMSMVRLPTRMSDGKANLHKGAIGAGIDIREGATLTAVWKNDIITEHPDTGNVIPGIKLPNWNILLNLAARCSELTGLGYLGVDIVLDRDKGPMILELNARPGLNIQIANRTGLLPRLKKVEAYGKNLKSITERVDFAREHFSEP